MLKGTTIMIENEIIKTLVKLHNEDETEWLTTLKTILDYYYDSANEKYKEIIAGEYNRLAKDINNSISNHL
ncbi:MAG: hypothetical protein J5687_02165 [Treponema sp.]|nr:hypothetical protein [Treponema sp.]